MPVKLRLRRQGRKGRPYYHIVAADSRSPRDGRFIERVGSYDPTTQPASIDVDHATALKWLRNGAQPTDTVRAILRYTGVNLKFALEKQGKDQETIDKMFDKWLAEKQSKINENISGIENKKRAEEKDRQDAERKVKEAKAAAIAAKNAPPVEETEEEAPEAEAAEAPEAEAEAPAEEAAAEEAPAEEGESEA